MSALLERCLDEAADDWALFPVARLMVVLWAWLALRLALLMALLSPIPLASLVRL